MGRGTRERREEMEGREKAKKKKGRKKNWKQNFHKEGGEAQYGSTRL